MHHRGSLPLAFLALLLAVVPVASLAQIPPGAVEQLKQVVGNRIEALTILGGDYAAAGGLYTFRGGKVASIAVSKVGGGGEVASRMPFAGCIEWSPVLQGNIGYISAENEFESGVLNGNEMQFDTFGVEGGGGVRFYFTEKLSLSPTISGIYGHTENTFTSRNPVGDAVLAGGKGTLVDWDIDTWSIVPALDFQYEWSWWRSVFTLTSRYNFFHTESFQSSSPVVSVNGDSQTWENKIDVDIPLKWQVFGHELHTGGFFSRTELYGDAAQGLNANHFYTVNSRLVLDLLGDFWKVRWFGFGASYFWSPNFDGWSAGADIRFQF